MRFIIFTLSLLSFISCNSQEKDYSELKFVYSDLVQAFKSRDEQKLKELCNRLVVDEVTLEYMRKHSLCYRGIPCKMDREGMDIKTVAEKFYPNLLHFRNILKSGGLLDSLTHIDSTDYKWEIEIFINEKIDGYDIIKSQNHHSISMENFNKALLRADSLGQTLDELFLNGKNGDVIFVKGTEMSMRLKSGIKIIEYRIGEMVLINNKWSLFTAPSVDFVIREE